MTSDSERAVFFDLDGTLLSFTSGYGEVLGRAVEEHVGERDEAVMAAYDDRFFDLFGEHAPAPYEAAFEHALAEAGYGEREGDDEGDGNGGGVGDVEPAALVASLRAAEVEFAEPPAGIERVLEALRERGDGVGVLTNGVPDWQRAKLAGNGLEEYVDAFVASYEAGAHKPDERAFALAAERLPADEYVMVGDSHAADVAGARATGWRGVHYAPDGEPPDAADAIDDFDALLDVLD